MTQSENVKPLNIIAISGSLKVTSSNTYVLKALEQSAGANVRYSIYTGIDTFPFFKPEIEAGTDTVNQFRSLLKVADGVIISTPEYAFGVPGVLKNALDWLVSSGELNEKPVVAISASPLSSGGDKAMASLLLTLKALGTKMDEQSSLKIGAINLKMNQAGTITDPQLVDELHKLFDHLLDIIRTIEITGE